MGIRDRKHQKTLGGFSPFDGSDLCSSWHGNASGYALQVVPQSLLSKGQGASEIITVWIAKATVSHRDITD